jgi:N-acetylglucosaminyldiphosphoundecaprenol N-acetyl-beta-D-mannosaminyltransferase
MANILGIKLSNFKKDELLKRLDFFLNEEKSHFLVTPNPEIILRAGQDEEYFYILNKADIAIADGFGIVLAGLLKRQKINRVTGSDLTPLILNLAEDKNYKILIINWRAGLSSKDDLEKTLTNKWPKLLFEILETDKKDYLLEEENNFINNFSPQIIFNTLGAPWQEKMIWHQLPKWPSVRLALAVGGSFDFLTEKIKRAPIVFRKLGIEWLWRLIKQPSRFKRIWTATVVFGLKAFNSIIIQPFLYRPNVASMLYKKDGDKIKILLVEREDDPGHWQIPQGGTDGEKIETAGARELREELNTDNFRVIKSFKEINSYSFNKKKTKNERDGYKGQKQNLVIAEFIGKDEEIKINYWDHRNWQWIEMEKLIQTVHPYRRESYKKFLDLFINTVK